MITETRTKLSPFCLLLLLSSIRGVAIEPAPAEVGELCSFKNGECGNPTRGNTCLDPLGGMAGVCAKWRDICFCKTPTCGNDWIDDDKGEDCDPPFNFDAINQCRGKPGTYCDHNCRCVKATDPCSGRFPLCSGPCFFLGKDGVCQSSDSEGTGTHDCSCVPYV